MIKDPIEKIVGPVIPLPTPFTADGEVDYEALRSYVEFLANNNIKNIMVTAGTSRLNLLTIDEVRKVNETVAKAAGDKAFTIAANPPHAGTGTTIELAKSAEQAGADIFLVIYPDRYYGDEGLYEYFSSIAESVEMSILIHEMPMRNGLGGGTCQYPIPLLKRLMEIDNIIGVKEEALDLGRSPSVVRELKDQAVIIGAGGGMSRYLRDYWLGSKTFLGGIGNFFPELELRFYDCMINGRIKEASEIIYGVELPFFQKLVPVGWHPSLKSCLACKDLLPRFERRPMRELSEEHHAIVEAAVNEIKR